MKNNKVSWRGALLIVSVFLGVIGFGLIYGFLNLEMGSAGQKTSQEAATVSTAPTVDEYREAAGGAMGPFMRLAFRAVESGSIVFDEDLLIAARTAESEMLKLRVPKDERDAHLEAVLLLEQWIRAIGGSRADGSKVADNMFKMVERRPWLYR